MYSNILPSPCFESFDALYSENKHADHVHFSVGDIVRRYEDNSSNPMLYKITSVTKKAWLQGDKRKSKHSIQVRRIDHWIKTTYTKNFPFIHARMEEAKVD